MHLADGTEKILIRQAFSEGRVMQGLLEGVAGIVPVLAIGIPLLLLAAAAVRTEGTKGGEKGVLCLSIGPWLRIWHGVLAVQILLLAAILFPALTDLLIYLIVYALLIYGFFLWERLCERNSEWNTWSWILFGIFWLRGIERMLELMSVYHL